jgi:hypothetical protein
MDLRHWILLYAVITDEQERGELDQAFAKEYPAIWSEIQEWRKPGSGRSATLTHTGLCGICTALSGERATRSTHPSSTHPSDRARKEGATMTNRDTHFKQFAQALMADLSGIDAQNWRQFVLEGEPILARRAFDLVHHTMLSTSCHDLDVLSTQECVLRIPDMAVLPEEEQS